ncbi:hypothetical protein [Ruminococcus flavefaciens]|uniref:hypothetical protein n=1 Tax=Ruminococcus flavefaciens TaxID=1265 RepID=UPI000316EAD5|nr:hypothetical protein [Ruminococcus flavefaciens]
MPFRTEEKELVCAVCGKSSAQTVVAEYDPDTSVPDLDLRPDEPHRSYIKYWVNECPHCGYCNASIDIHADFTREFLESDKYRKCGDGLTGRFKKMSLVCEKNRIWKEALKSRLYAAWAYDDEGSDEQAAECRRAAVKIFDTHRAELSADSDIVLLTADLLRRSGDFERVIRDFKDRLMASELMMVIADYQAELAEKGDRACHKADEIPGVTVR